MGLDQQIDRIIISRKTLYRNISLVLCFCLASLVYGQNEQYGIASYYADRFEGLKTASGELYCQDSLTAAHPNLPFGTMVKVTNLKDDLVVVVKINDRGPNIPGRIIDLSRKAMMLINGTYQGVIEVKVEVLADP